MDANPDNYGVDIMGAAESLAYEAVFLIRQNKEAEHFSFSPKMAVFQVAAPEGEGLGWGWGYG